MFSKQFDLLLLSTGETSWPRWCSSSGEGAALPHAAAGGKAIRRLRFSPVACFSWLAAEGPHRDHPLMKITGSGSLACGWHCKDLTARGESLGCIFRTKLLMLGMSEHGGLDSGGFWRVGLCLVVLWKLSAFCLHPVSRHLQHSIRGVAGSLPLVPPECSQGS